MIKTRLWPRDNSKPREERVPWMALVEIKGPRYRHRESGEIGDVIAQCPCDETYCLAIEGKGLAHIVSWLQLAEFWEKVK